jgi:hypothetical protein
MVLARHRLDVVLNGAQLGGDVGIAKLLAVDDELRLVDLNPDLGELILDALQLSRNQIHQFFFSVCPYVSIHCRCLVRVKLG